MELRHLRYFVTVAEELHFGRAAKRLHLAQPALSQQIQRFEKILGTTLFDRTTRTVTLTLSGQALLPEARHVLRQADRALAVVHQSTSGATGTVRCGSVSSASLTVIPLIARSIRRDYPDVTLELADETSDNQIYKIRDGKLDFGIMREVKPSADLTIRPLLSERLVVAFSDDHPLAGREVVRIDELAEINLVMFPRNRVTHLYDHISRLFSEDGFEFNVTQEALQFTTILGFVAANAGAAIIPESLSALNIPTLSYAAIDKPSAKSVLSLIYSNDYELNPLLTNILATISKAYPVRRQYPRRVGI